MVNPMAIHSMMLVTEMKRRLQASGHFFSTDAALNFSPCNGSSVPGIGLNLMA
jgi:hypothetical protein